MDQILHRKLIIEKNNLQLEVAKANKEIAKLMETVQQYEAVLASLDEGMIPNKMKLRGPVDSAGKHERDFVDRAHQQGRKLTNQEHAALRQHAKNDSAANAKIAAAKGISEATLVRGKAAMELKAKLSGKKLPTAEEAAKEMEEIKAAKELYQAGLGKLKKSRLSIMNRLGKKQEVQEGFKDFVKDMGSKLKTIGKDALANVKKDMGTMKAKVSPANIKAGVKALPGKIEAAAKKMPTQQQNIDFVKNTVVPMIGRVGAEMQRDTPKHIKKRNAAIGRIFKP